MQKIDHNPVLKNQMHVEIYDSSSSSCSVEAWIQTVDHPPTPALSPTVDRFDGRSEPHAQAHERVRTRSFEKRHSRGRSKRRLSMSSDRSASPPKRRRTQGCETLDGGASVRTHPLPLSLNQRTRLALSYSSSIIGAPDNRSPSPARTSREFLIDYGNIHPAIVCGPPSIPGLDLTKSTKDLYKKLLCNLEVRCIPEQFKVRARYRIC